MIRDAAPVDDDAGFARRQLVLLLQLAYSGELGAARAYAGHRASLRERNLRADVGRILREELRHRHCILTTLRALGAEPDPWRERKMDCIGRGISLFCRVGGWFFPMYGAGLLESQNIREYEHGARLAHVAGRDAQAEQLVALAETEWDHEHWFRTQAASHWLWHFLPHWAEPPPRATIRESFTAFVASDEKRIDPMRIPWLVR